MNNQDKVAELQRIISIAQDDLALLMKKGKRFKPETTTEFWHIDDAGEVVGVRNRHYNRRGGCYDNFNCYETEELATKASPMMRRSNAIITACLQVDPDFVPDYLSGNQVHYSFSFLAGDISSKPRWIQSHSYTLNYGPCVSTRKKWEEAAALLKEWGIE
jgi:hypothetical protein